MEVQIYLHYNGKCAEALEFYKQALGAKIDTVMHFKDAPPDPKNPVKPEVANQVMHSSFRIGDTTIMASDCGQPMQGFSLSVGFGSSEEVERAFNALSKGGKVTQPLSETFFAHKFGQCDDPYGVNWILLHSKHMPMQQTA
jgi:PhnB protein